MSELRLPITEHGRLAQANAAEDRYRLGEEIARGGMGVVYRACDELLGREVAVKLLLASPGERPDLVRRFVQEARITGRLQHPGIPPVYELGWLTDGRPFLALKLIEGHTLAEKLAGRGDPAADREALLAAFERVCDTVAYAHAERIVHRDLKPANIMVGAFGEVQVVDWGLARDLEDGGPEDAPPAAAWDRSPPLLTDPKNLLGTPAYMAPERARGERGDERCDVFGLGAILCEVLTGRPPYGAALDRALVGNPAGGLAELSGCGADPRLITLATACLAPDPAGRPAAAAALAAEVKAHHDWVAARLRADAAGRSRRRLIALAALLLASLGWLAWGQYRAEASRLEQNEEREKAALQIAADALDRANGAIRLGHWGRAAVALRVAEERLPPGDGRDAVVRLLDEAKLANDLEEVRLRGRLLVTGDGVIAPDPRAYEQAFLLHGWDFRGGEVEALTARLRALAVTREAFNALYCWLVVEPPGPGRDRLLAALGGADDDEWRRRARAELGRDDPGALRRLAADLPTSPQPAALIGDLARRLGPAGLRMRRAAQRHTPDDFWSNHELAAELGTLPGHAREALGYARAAVALRPDEPTAWNNLGVLLLRGREYGDACQALERAAALGPDLALTRVNYGTALLRAGRRAEAAAACAWGLERVPEFAPAHLLDGLLAHADGDDARARAALHRAVELDPRLVAARVKLALLEAKAGERASARGRLDEGLQLGEDAGLLAAKALVLLQDGDPAGARRASERAALLDPYDPLCRLTWAAALDREGDAAGALAQAGAALRREPSSLTAVLKLSPFRDLRSVPLPLERLSDEVVHLHPDRAESWTLRGLAFLQRRRGQDADDACRRALAINSQFGAAHLVRGMALELAGRHDAALSAYRLAQGHRTADPRPLIAMGTLRLVRREVGLARDCFLLLEREKTDPAGAALGLAGVDMARRAWGAAAARLDEGLKLWPGEPRLLNARGMVALQTGRPADARTQFEAAVRRDPSLTVARVNLGRLLLALGRKEDGLAALRRACELAPADADARFNLGRGLTESGDPAAAEAALREAIQRDDTRLDARLALAGVLSTLNRDGEAESLIAPLTAARPGDGELQRRYGELLLRSHRYRDAVATLERAGASDALAQARRMVRLDGKLSAVLRGEERLDPGEAMDLADVCAWGRGRPADAATMLVTFLAGGPLAATDPRRGWHARAARVAVAAGGPAWRRQALTWLDRERRAWERLHAEAGVSDGEVRAALSAWRADPKLAAVRDKEALRRLPAEEADAWRRLWRAAGR